MSEERSLSKERGKISAGRDTNSNDSRALRCRVFIGNLATDKTSKAEVEEIFKKIGEVTSCSLHNNFGFIQYEDEKDADRAVDEMHGKTLFGKRVDVNLAGLRRKPQSKDQYEGAPPKEAVVPAEMLKNGSRPPRRDRSPIRGDRDGSYGRSSYDDSYGREHGRDPRDQRMDSYGGYPPSRIPYNDYRDMPYSRPEGRPLPQHIRPAIDCEIVSLSKEETRYAEEVEGRLRSIGLVCNIGYPPSELPILELMDRIARTGTLYAVVVTSQNATHRSCTLHLLHGTREEHRNMPLDNCLSFVARKFDSYLRSLREPMHSVHLPTTYLPPRDNIAPIPTGPAPVANPVTSYPNREKQMSTEEIEAMINKLKREKEEREVREAGMKPAVENVSVRTELPPASSTAYPYYPVQGQNNGSTTAASVYPPRQYDQQPFYR